MYEYICGVVTGQKSNYIILENNKIGYLIYTANPYSFNIGDEYRIYLYQYVREDEINLYGFKEEEEKNLFLKLINVKGLGCKMALPMLSASISGIIDAIERENILYLKKFPKIGDKVARQIILDLKGKLISYDNINNSSNDNNELTDALVALGYKTQDVKKIIPSIDKNKSIEEQIKDALKLFLK